MTDESSRSTSPVAVDAATGFDQPTVPHAGTIGDVVAVVAAVVASVSVALDLSSIARPVAALAFVVFVPGWALLRLFRVPVTSLMVLASCVTSFVMMAISSILLATRLGWAWEIATYLWAVASVAAIVVARRRGAKAAS